MKIKSLLIICWLVFFATSLFAQSKYDKGLLKAEVAYKKGDYPGARKALDKIRKKINSKLGAQNQYTSGIFLSLAKYDLGSGMPMDFESNLQNALNSSKTLNSENSEKYAALLIDAAELYILNGSFRVAKEYLANSKKTLEAGGFFKDPLKGRWDLAMGEVLAGQGFYNESITLFKSRSEYFVKRALKSETIPDGKGGLQTRKVPEGELEQRLEDYARLITDIATTYGKQGLQISSDTAFNDGARWIDRNIGNHSLAYVRNQLNYGKMLSDYEVPYEKFPKDAEYDRTLNIVKAFFKPTHYLGIQLYEEYLKELLRGANTARYYNTKLEYEKLINKEFPSRSVFQARLKAVELDQKLDNDKTKNLEATANSILTNTAGLPTNSIVTTEILDFLVELSITEKKYGNVEGYLKQITDIKTELYGADAPETHLSKIRLANFYVDYTNKITEAGKIYDDSFTKIVEKQIRPWHKDNLETLNHLAIFYEFVDQYKKADATLEKAADVARSKFRDDDYVYGAELTRIAKLQIKLGKYEGAEENLTKALKILEASKKYEESKRYLVEAIDAQATLLGIKGLFDEAADALARSAKIIKRSDKNLVDDLSTAEDLASLFIQLGNYSETSEILDNLITEYEKIYGTNSLRLIEPLVNKGKLLLAEGDYTNADKIALRANTIAVTTYTDKSTKSAASQKLLSEIDYTIGDYEKAENNILKAIASQEKQFGRNHIDVAKSLSQLGLIKFYKGDNKKEVEKIMVEARNIIGTRLTKDNPQYADILKNLAVLYISQKQYDLAFSALTQAESIWRLKTGNKNSVQAASIFTLTGDVYYQLKKYDKAEEFYKKGKDLYEKYFSDKHPEYVKVLSKLARVYYMQKDFKSAKKNIELALNNYELFIKHFFPALSEREKAKYWNTIKGDFEFYNTLAFGQLEDFRDLSGKVYNYQLLTKALLLSSSIKIRERILNSKDETLIANYTDWIAKKESLTAALSMSTQQLVDNNIDPAAMGNEVERLERELSEKSEIFGQSFENKRITYENVQSVLGKTDVAIEMVRYRYFNHTFTDSIIYVALYVKGDRSRPKAVNLPEGYKMETRYFKAYRNSMLGKIHDDYSYKVFWEPIQKEVGQYSTIYFSPDGVYNQINLEAIPTPDGKYVIDNSNIVMVSNTKDLYLRKIKGKLAGTIKNNASMFGNPTFYLTASANKEWLPLPGTEKEVDELNALLKQKGWITSEYMEGTASEEKIKLLDNPRIFHIATHGFYTKAEDISLQKALTENEAMMAENPLMKSGLLLSGGGDILAKTNYNYNIENGVLTAYEAMSLNLDQTDLVVLSACETGLGEISNGEGVYGLQRAFFVAGAKVLIMSMFKVDDDATQKLILNFYKKWLTTGNMRQSFVDAKKELRLEYPDPIYWGAFMMIGQE
ncbi:hypothetical protein BH09BAC3_BH09BAC3_35070 [soil metagenome]